MLIINPIGEDMGKFFLVSDKTQSNVCISDSILVLCLFADEIIPFVMQRRWNSGILSRSFCFCTSFLRFVDDTMSVISSLGFQVKIKKSLTKLTKIYIPGPHQRMKSRSYQKYPKSCQNYHIMQFN